jgi:PST family polysaccharide transporter
VRAFDERGVFRGDVRHDSGNLRTLVVKSAGITTLSQGAKVVIQIASTIVLARLLTPVEFGLMTMVTTFSLLFVNFGVSGFTEAVIQRETIDHGLASNLFWANMGFIVALTLIFAAAGPLMAWFYKDPRVTGVAAATALTILFSGLSVMHLALLRRAMQFTAISLNEIVAQASSVLVSVILAVLGWGYWALVAGVVALPLVTAIGAWVQCRWIPGLPRRGLNTTPMVRFALNIYGYFTVNYFSRNLDNLLVGSFFGPQALGSYKKAFDLAIFPIVQAAGPLNSVAVPTLSRLKDDPDKYCRYILRSLGVLALLGMGAGACLTLIGKDLIRLLLGPKWGESGRIFLYFAPGIGAMFIYRIAGWLHLSMGSANRFFRWGMIEFAVLGSMFVMALPWGPVGIGLVWGVSCWLLTIPAILYAPRPAQLTLTSMLAVVWPYAGGSALGGAACAVILRGIPWLPTGSGPIDLTVRMLTTSALFGVLYLISTALLHRGWTPLLEIGSLVRDMAPWRKLSPVSPAVVSPVRPT